MIQQEGKQILDVKLERAHYAEVGLEYFLSNLSLNERAQEIDRVILEAAKRHNDDAVLALLAIQKSIYEEIELQKVKQEVDSEKKRKIRDESRADFINYLRQLYKGLPDVQNNLEYQGGGRDDRKISTLTKSKEWILQRIIWSWDGDQDDGSLSLFRFIIVAGKFDEERKFIQDTLRDQVRAWRPEKLEFWLKQQNVPESIEKVLLITRARNGGAELVRRDIYFAEILKPLAPQERTLGALKFHKEFCEKLRRLESKLEDLVKKRMKLEGEFCVGTRKVGGSEYVIGDIKIDYYEDIDDISMTISMHDNYSKELCQDVFGRARRHVEAWLNEYHPGDPHFRLLLKIFSKDFSEARIWVKEGSKYKSWTVSV